MPKKKGPTNQHYIPKVLLKNFCDSHGLIWVWDGAKVYPTTPKKAFRIKDLYTRRDFTNATTDAGHQTFLDSIEKSYEYEERLSKLENQTDPVIQQIIERARNGKPPQLSVESRDIFRRFVFAMARRTPESQERVVAEKPEEAFYKMSKLRAEADGHQWPSKEDLYQVPSIHDLKDMVISNFNAQFSAGDHPDLMREERKFIKETGLSFAVIDIPERSLLIGSHGLTIGSKGSVIEGSWLPIAHDVMVGVTHFPDRDTLEVLDNSNNGSQIVSAINQATAAMSKVIAGQSESLVRSMIRK